MKLGNVSVNAGNYISKTPGKIKLICDFLLLLSLIITVLWPEVDIAIKIGVVIKLLSNFISEHTPDIAQKDDIDEKVD